MEKKWYQSRTIWIGILETLAGILTAIAGELSVGGVLTISGIVKIILRTITTSPLLK